MDESRTSARVNDRRISRRGFVQTVSGAALAGGVGVQLLLEACAPATAPAAPPASTASTTGTSGTAGAPAASTLPTYFAPQSLSQPAYHSDDPRITDGYDTYPTNPPKSWTKAAPGAGSTVNVFIVSYYPTPTPYDQNATWKEINRQLNANVQMNMVPGPTTR